jgi:hypothetical protein
MPPRREGSSSAFRRIDLWYGGADSLPFRLDDVGDFIGSADRNEPMFSPVDTKDDCSYIEARAFPRLLNSHRLDGLVGHQPDSTAQQSRSSFETFRKEAIAAKGGLRDAGAQTQGKGCDPSPFEPSPSAAPGRGVPGGQEKQGECQAAPGKVLDDRVEAEDLRGMAWALPDLEMVYGKASSSFMAFMIAPMFPPWGRPSTTREPCSSGSRHGVPVPG